MRSPAPTIRTIAAALGLSRTTVSDALRNASWVRPETAERVKRAATEAGYKPNPFGGAVMSQMRAARGNSFLGVLAVVDMDEADRPAVATRFHDALIEGASGRASELGFKLQRFLVGKNGVNIRRLDTIMQSRGIQGVLLLPSWGEPDFSTLDWSKYAGVYTDYIIERPALHAICSDHYRSMISVLYRLKQFGYKRPGLFLQRHQDERLQYRRVGAFKGFLENHPEIDSIPVLLMDEVDAKTFILWFRRYKPDVVIGHPLQVIDWMETCGASVPETHGFVSLNLIAQNRLCAGLDQQSGLLGVRGVELLIAQLQRNERGIPELPSTTMLPALWVDGPTLRLHSGDAQPQTLKASAKARDQRS